MLPSTPSPAPKTAMLVEVFEMATLNQESLNPLEKTLLLKAALALAVFRRAMGKLGIKEDA